MYTFSQLEYFSSLKIISLLHQEAMKVLVIRYSSLGDVVLTTPVIRALATQSNATVHVITKSAYACIFEGNPYVRKVWSSEVTSVNTLRQEDYDQVIDLQGSLRSVKLKLCLGRWSKSYDKQRNRTRKYLRSKQPDLAPTHVVERYFACVQHLDVRDDQKGLDFFGVDKSKSKKGNRLEVAIVLGGTQETKRIPHKLAEAVIQENHRNYTLLGGRDVAHLTFEESSHVHNQLGKTSIIESVSRLSSSDIVMSQYPQKLEKDLN